MLSLKCLVVLMIASCSAQHPCGRKGMSIGLIVGGTKSARNEWPWLASLFDITTQKFFCGATIISEKIVMTAAHCLQPKGSSVIKRADEVIAYLGKHNVNLAHERDVEAFYPSEVSIHPDWNVYSERFDADLAILRSENQIRFSNKISPACLWNDSLEENDEGVVVGWGSSNVTTLSEHEDVSRQVKVKKISSQKCYEDFHLFAAIASPRTFCGGGVVENSGPCSGDSGGGFFVSINKIWFINGIVSASFLTSDSHCDLSKYALFTKLSEFKAWITGKIQTTVATVSPCNEPAVDRKACSSIDNLYDNFAKSRLYLKSLCTIPGRVTYDEANQKCREAGMQLFVVKNSAEQIAFVDAVSAQFANFNSSVGWINGQLKPNGKWVSYDPQEVPLFNELNWGENNSGKCLIIKKNLQSERQFFGARNCSRTHWTYCEFKDDLLLN